MNTVAALASPKRGRYAFAAMQRLQEHGWNAVPVNPEFTEVTEGDAMPPSPKFPCRLTQ